MAERFNYCLTAAATLAICSMLCRVSGVAIASDEETVVDGIAVAMPDRGGNGTGGAASARLKEPLAAKPGRSQYLTNTGYVIPMESSLRPTPISDGEVSVYVAIGILTLIAVALIIAGSVFCYKYSAALRASESAQPIILHSRCPRGDDKLARHAQKAYYQRQKQGMAAAFGDKNRLSGASIPEEDSDQDDQNIYGCQGLASTSGLEVNNPMFQEPAHDER